MMPMRKLMPIMSVILSVFFFLLPADSFLAPSPRMGRLHSDLRAVPSRRGNSNPRDRSKKPLELSDIEIAVGTRAWGDEELGFKNNFKSKDLRKAYDVLTDGGVNLFVTNEMFGRQALSIALSMTPRPPASPFPPEAS